MTTPIFLAAVTMLMLDRHDDGGYFSGAVGEPPLLWQHFSYIFFTASYMAISITALAAIAGSSRPSPIVNCRAARSSSGR